MVSVSVLIEDILPFVLNTEEPLGYACLPIYQNKTMLGIFDKMQITGNREPIPVAQTESRVLITQLLQLNVYFLDYPSKVWFPSINSCREAVKTSFSELFPITSYNPISEAVSEN